MQLKSRSHVCLLHGMFTQLEKKILHELGKRGVFYTIQLSQALLETQKKEFGIWRVQGYEEEQELFSSWEVKIKTNNKEKKI